MDSCKFNAKFNQVKFTVSILQRLLNCQIGAKTTQQ